MEDKNNPRKDISCDIFNKMVSLIAPVWKFISVKLHDGWVYISTHFNLWHFIHLPSLKDAQEINQHLTDLTNRLIEQGRKTTEIHNELLAFRRSVRTQLRERLSDISKRLSQLETAIADYSVTEQNLSSSIDSSHREFSQQIETFQQRIADLKKQCESVNNTVSTLASHAKDTNVSLDSICSAMEHTDQIHKDIELMCTELMFELKLVVMNSIAQDCETVTTEMNKRKTSR